MKILRWTQVTTVTKWIQVEDDQVELLESNLAFAADKLDLMFRMVQDSTTEGSAHELDEPFTDYGDFLLVSEGGKALSVLGDYWDYYDGVDCESDHEIKETNRDQYNMSKCHWYFQYTRPCDPDKALLLEGWSKDSGQWICPECKKFMDEVAESK